MPSTNPENACCQAFQQVVTPSVMLHLFIHMGRGKVWTMDWVLRSLTASTFSAWLAEVEA